MKNITVNRQSKLLLFILTSTIYCLCSYIALKINSGFIFLFFTSFPFIVEFFISSKLNLRYSILMFSSFLPAIIYIIAFEISPTNFVDCTEISLWFCSFRVLLTLKDTIKAKKYAFATLSFLASGLIFYLSYIISEYQSQVLIRLELPIK